MGGIAKTNGVLAVAVAKWMHEDLGQRLFQWQEKYGAFTIGISQKASTVRYIQNQKKHHAKMNFAREWRTILERHGLHDDE